MTVPPLSQTESSTCKGCGLPVETPFLQIQSRFANVQVQNYRAFRCNQCGLVYVCPDPPDSDLEQMYSAENYLELLFDNPKWRRWVVQRHWLPVLVEIERNISKNLLLDVGCSDGLFMDFARDRDWKVFGVDVNQEKVRRARQHHGDHVRFGSVYTMDWPDDQFDAVRLCHVLEHLADPRRALSNLNRVLRCGGLLNVGVPVLDDQIFYWLRRIPLSGMQKKLIEALGWMGPPHHLTTWSTRSLERSLKTYGFEVIWKSYRSDVLPWIKGFRRHCLFYRSVGVPMRLLGSGTFIEVLARKIS